MLKIIYRKDMKTAMQTKDSNRLNVLRSLLTQTLNASKTSNPINTDMQMLAMVRKEEDQVRIMEEYAAGVEVLGEDDVKTAIKSVVDAMKSEGVKMQMGEVLKKVFAPEVLGSKPVDKGEVAKVVKQTLAES